MSWEQDYFKALALTLVKNGVLVMQESPSDSSWRDKGDNITFRNWSQYGPILMDYQGGDAHFRVCGAAQVSRIQEENISEFMGTFTDNDNFTTVAGKIDCNCGQLQGRWVVYRGTISELISKVLAVDETQVIDLREL